MQGLNQQDASDLIFKKARLYFGDRIKGDSRFFQKLQKSCLQLNVQALSRKETFLRVKSRYLKDEFCCPLLVLKLLK